MRRRSITGPLMLLLIGGLFLWNNFHPEASIWAILSTYWPFLLILWGVLRLIEVLWPRHDDWHGGLSGGEVVLIVLICFAGWGVWEGHRHGITWRAGGLDMFADAYEYPVTVTASAQGMKRIVFDNFSGNIKITGADTGDVQVSGHKSIRAFGRGDADRTNGNTPVEILPQGDHLVLRTNQDRAPDTQRVSADLEVTVPRALAVEAHIRRGDFEISDIAGDVELEDGRGSARLSRVGGNVRLQTGRSDVIRAVDVKGRVDIQGQGADLSLENVQGKVSINGGYTGSLEFKNLAQPLDFQGSRATELHVEAVPGRITMDMGEFNGAGMVGPVRLVTRSRDIRMSGFTQSVSLETQRGDIELQPSLPMPVIEARSGSGDIDLVVPENATFQLDASAERGDAVNDYGPPFQKATAGRTTTLKGNKGNGPLVRLTAARGSVDLRKEGTPAATDPAPGSAEGAPGDVPPKAAKPSKLPKSLKETEIKL